MGEEIELSFDAANGGTAVTMSNAVPSTEGAKPRTVPPPEDDEEAYVGGGDVDKHGKPEQCPGEVEQKPKELIEEMKKDNPTSVFGAGIEAVKYLCSSVLLVVCVIIVHAAMFTKQTTATADMGIHPAGAFFIFWSLIIWLGMMEGGQGALVGLQSIDKALYKESHRHALMSTSLVHKGDNMERFIIGRQCLVVVVVTVLNMIGSSVKGASVLGLPDIAAQIFLASGVAMILTTIMIGQLAAQINAANCMLDFINTYFMLFTSYISLGIEFSGLLHCVYLVQIVFAKITSTPIQSDEPPRTAPQNFFFWTRVLMSCAILGFSFAVTLVALFEGKTGMWEGVPASVSVIIFFLLMFIVGMMEGMQIALFAVLNMPDEELENHAFAQKVCRLVFSGSNLQAFLIGRQIFVATCTFIIARIASPKYEEGDKNIFDVSDDFQAFLNTGLTGAVINTIIGSLAWRIIASSFPVAFLSNPLIYMIARVCLILEASGLCSGAWLLAWIQKKIMGYQRDEIYIRTAEERAALDKELENEA
jgi:hypothetical protein